MITPREKIMSKKVKNNNNNNKSLLQCGYINFFFLIDFLLCTKKNIFIYNIDNNRSHSRLTHTHTHT